MGLGSGCGSFSFLGVVYFVVGFRVGGLFFFGSAGIRWSVSSVFRVGVRAERSRVFWMIFFLEMSFNVVL